MAAVYNTGDIQSMEALEFFGDGTKEPTNWKKCDELDRGAFGVVYKAIIETNGYTLELAVKKVKISWNGPNLMEPQVNREIEALKKLRHDRIVKYYNSHLHNDRLYIFIELMNGGSLESFLKTKNDRNEPIDEQYAGRIIQQVIEAVDYLHKNKRFHRDIKSGNVLMSDENNVKLADFGLTKEFATITKSNTKGVGTICFMAPEMFGVDKENKPIEYNKSVDIWAIGCVVVHMLTGQLPFHNLEQQQVLYQLIANDANPAKEIKVSESCRRFFNKTLCRDPKGRATAESLLNDSFVTGKVSDIDTDAVVDEQNVTEEDNKEDVMDEPNAKLQEFGIKGHLQNQSATTNVTIGTQYKNCTTNITFQGIVNFNSSSHFDQIGHLNVNHLENLKADQIGKVDVQQASGSVSVGKAEAVKAQGNSVHIQRANTVETKDTKTVNVHKADRVKANKPEVVNIDHVQTLVIK
ncbi:hypothetical protein Btru_052172 [Bulinus truncatus]|nr:hypothetical protein Btru_052172 [Bulinus truncatus]